MRAISYSPSRSHYLPFALLHKPLAKTDSITPPAGWTEKPATFSMSGATLMKAWSPRGQLHPTSIVLAYADIAATGAATSIESLAAVMNTQFKTMLGAGNPVVSRAQKVCNGTAEGGISKII